MHQTASVGKTLTLEFQCALLGSGSLRFKVLLLSLLVLITPARSHQDRSAFYDAMPDGVVLDRQYSGRKELELLVKLHAARSSGQLEAVVEDG